MAQANPYIVDLKRLPAELQESLIELQTPGEDRFAFLRSVSLIYIIPLVAVAIWLIYLYTASQQPLWEDWMYYLVCGISIVLITVAFLALIKLLPRFSRLKDGYVVTRDEFLKFTGGKIEVWNLKQLDALRFKEHDNEVEVWMGDREEKIRLTQHDEARRLDDVFDSWKQDADSGLSTQLADKAFQFGGTQRTAMIAAGAVVAALIGLGTAQLFSRANRNFDDEMTWNRAGQADSIEELESYKARHPAGSFVAQAETKVRERVERVKDDYVASAAKGADPVAVAAFASMLEQTAKRPDRTIYIRVAETREIDDNIVKDLGEKYFITVNGYDVSVPKSAEAFRKNKVFSDVKLILTNTKNKGAIRFELVDNLPADAPGIDINLLIKSEPAFFRVSTFEDGRYRTSNYATASFLFRVDLRDGTGSPPHHMEYAGQPLVVSSGAYNQQDKENYTFDKIYFGTAVDGFDRMLQHNLGFAEVPAPSVGLG
jgi:hypothetical protein